MNCEKYSESMMKYFDSQINDIESAQLKQHMRTCARCSKEFEDMESILHLLETDAGIEPPADFEEKVMFRVREVQPVWKKIPDTTIKFLYGFTSFLLVLLLFMFAVTMFKEGAFKGITDEIGPLNSISDFFTSAQNVCVAIWGVVSDLAQAAFKMTMMIAKAYYYIIIMVVVMLFAINWTFVSLVKQNQGDHVK